MFSFYLSIANHLSFSRPCYCTGFFFGNILFALDHGGDDEGQANAGNTSSPFHANSVDHTEANITVEEARVVLKLVPRACSDPLAGSMTAWDLLIREMERRRIATGRAEVDKILGGGVLCKELTEICGVPGVGKTQLSMQLAVNVQIPAAFGGVGGHAIYIGRTRLLANMAHKLMAVAEKYDVALNSICPVLHNILKH